MKEKFNKDMENLRKKNQTEMLEIKSSLNLIKNTEESHSSRLEQVEDRLEDKIDIKGKIEELLDKKFKRCERNMQELSDSIKRPNLQITGIEEGEEVHPKIWIYNIFNKIVAENFSNLKKELSIQVQATSRTPRRLDQNRTSPRHIIIKPASSENRE
jgi:hypothetical protein